jgi:hypothetical protein
MRHLKIIAVLLLSGLQFACGAGPGNNSAATPASEGDLVASREAGTLDAAIM